MNYNGQHTENYGDYIEPDENLITEEVKQDLCNEMIYNFTNKNNTLTLHKRLAQLANKVKKKADKERERLMNVETQKTQRIAAMVAKNLQKKYEWDKSRTKKTSPGAEIKQELNGVMNQIWNKRLRNNDFILKRFPSSEQRSILNLTGQRAQYTKSYDNILQDNQLSQNLFDRKPAGKRNHAINPNTNKKNDKEVAPQSNRFLTRGKSIEAKVNIVFCHGSRDNLNKIERDKQRNIPIIKEKINKLECEKTSPTNTDNNNNQPQSNTIQDNFDKERGKRQSRYYKKYQVAHNPKKSKNSYPEKPHERKSYSFDNDQVPGTRQKIAYKLNGHYKNFISDKMKEEQIICQGLNVSKISPKKILRRNSGRNQDDLWVSNARKLHLLQKTQQNLNGLCHVECDGSIPQIDMNDIAIDDSLKKKNSGSKIDMVNFGTKYFVRNVDDHTGSWHNMYSDFSEIGDKDCPSSEIRPGDQDCPSPEIKPDKKIDSDSDNSDFFPNKSGFANPKKTQKRKSQIKKSEMPQKTIIPNPTTKKKAKLGPLSNRKKLDLKKTPKTNPKNRTTSYTLTPDDSHNLFPECQQYLHTSFESFGEPIMYKNQFSKNTEITIEDQSQASLISPKTNKMPPDYYSMLQQQKRQQVKIDEKNMEDELNEYSNKNNFDPIGGLTSSLKRKSSGNYKVFETGKASCHTAGGTGNIRLRNSMNSSKDSKYNNNSGKYPVVYNCVQNKLKLSLPNVSIIDGRQGAYSFISRKRTNKNSLSIGCVL